MTDTAPDLLAFEEAPLYFDETPLPGTEELLAEAAVSYGQPSAELALLRAYFFAPRQLSVLVALYRYYYYQHRLEDALRVAERAMDAAAGRLALTGDWHSLSLANLGEVARHSIGLLRFYLLALKASAIVLLRSGNLEEGHARLKKIIELDPQDRLGAGALMRIPGVAPNLSSPL